MEERIIDRDEERKIRLTRTGDGEQDAVDALSPEGEAEQEEAVLALPETDEYDEDLVGLTPSQLEAELERRERARKEAREMSEKLSAEGEKFLEEGDFANAESSFQQALVYGLADERAENGLWRARTHDYTETEPLYRADYAEELSASSARDAVLERLKERICAERDAFSEEEKQLAPLFEEKQTERRAAFSANKKYYLIRFCIAAVLLVGSVIGIIVSADNILRTQSAVPIILTAVFGALCFIFLMFAVIFSRKLVVAARFCRKNEKLASTEEGAHLESLREKIASAALILGENE